MNNPQQVLFVRPNKPPKVRQTIDDPRKDPRIRKEAKKHSNITQQVPTPSSLPLEHLLIPRK